MRIRGYCAETIAPWGVPTSQVQSREIPSPSGGVWSLLAESKAGELCMACIYKEDIWNRG